MANKQRYLNPNDFEGRSLITNGLVPNTPKYGARPKTDQEARLCCIACLHIKAQDQEGTPIECELVGEITVATRHECFLRGLADIRQPHPTSQRGTDGIKRVSRDDLESDYWLDDGGSYHA